MSWSPPHDQATLKFSFIRPPKLCVPISLSRSQIDWLKHMWLDHVPILSLLLLL